MTTKALSHTRINAAFAYLCALLSPCTPDEEVQKLRQTAVRGDADWEALAWCANRAGLAPALRTALEDKGLRELAPEMLRSYLDEIHSFNTARNESLLDMLREVTQLLNNEGITPLLLKGGAALATGLFPDPGTRFMWDLDILVPAEKLELSVSALTAAGYSVPEKYCDGSGTVSDLSVRHHYPPLTRPGAPTAVELHCRVLSSGEELLETAAVLRESRPYAGCRLPGISATVMSPTDELIHGIIHSEISHHQHRMYKVDARHMHHFSCLVNRYREQIDWDRIDALLQHPRFGKIFRSYFYLAKMLFRLNLPISTEPDVYAKRHYRIATSSKRSSWLLVHLLFRELSWVFSKKRLQQIYRDTELSITRLRLRHLLILLGRYHRPNAMFKRLWVLLKF